MENFKSHLTDFDYEKVARNQAIRRRQRQLQKLLDRLQWNYVAGARNPSMIHQINRIREQLISLAAGVLV